MATHKAVQMQSAGAPLRLVDVETLSPGRDEVRLAVSACGICGTDRAFVSGGFPDMLWPLTLGPEIGRIIAELGEGIDDFAVGERVAVGWFGGHCNHCDHCRKGIFIHCANMKVPSWHYPGGYLRLGHFGVQFARAMGFETMHFAVVSGVRAWIEELPLSQAADGYAAMEQGRARYRTVLTM
ncbi:hypothetical protein B586_11510 [Mycobacterium haemophilum DSM 44634]|uniref:alcohol dehydrogenase catalytic domain-containing protein n=1 Tax=Mycobacterium haemophilum TaxID=29311 RepID=UPI0006562764|nr:alcohol dehydrogenase catalytic domain-containing protein [Mycobacterium haemophilum]AKN17035.1 hypothetical protein B586_11510 [Mycobacterium haemophilum DSM 44634]MCV7340469.1 alcohol dehydrogenase catalytic domain-containing protein [Mycobacterium haemophilum DSM 44634]